jgi:uncharacterized protein
VVQSARHPLRLNVGFLLHQGVGASRDFEFDLPEVTVAVDLTVRRLQGTLRLSRTAQGLYAQGALQAAAPVECVRCLEGFEQPLSIEVADLFLYPAPPESDPALRIPETAQLDLSLLLREYLMLGLPMRPVCRDDCQGLCPACGVNRNHTSCDHPAAGLDPRLSALSSLLSES